MVKKGSIIKVDFDAYTAEGELFDTTSKEVAKKEDKFSENVPYDAMPLVVGVGRVIPGFDRALEDADVGQEVEVTIPPEDAFGERDPAKVDTVPLREFQKQDVHPHPGMRVNYSGKQGYVSAVSAGRVRIDRNAPLAGKTLRYKFTIREIVEDPVEQVKALIDADYGMGKADSFDVTRDDATATVKLPDACKYDQRWFVAKYRLVSDLRQYADVKTVRFVEEYVTEEAPLPPEAAPAPQGESPAADAASETATHSH